MVMEGKLNFFDKRKSCNNSPSAKFVKEPPFVNAVGPG